MVGFEEVRRRSKTPDPGPTRVLPSLGLSPDRTYTPSRPPCRPPVLILYDLPSDLPGEDEGPRPPVLRPHGVGLRGRRTQAEENRFPHTDDPVSGRDGRVPSLNQGVGVESPDPG